jgi:hypothetical protein
VTPFMMIPMRFVFISVLLLDEMGERGSGVNPAVAGGDFRQKMLRLGGPPAV